MGFVYMLIVFSLVKNVNANFMHQLRIKLTIVFKKIVHTHCHF